MVGVLVLVLSLVNIDRHSPAWPPDAAQLICVLLLAVAIEQRAFKGPPRALLMISAIFLALVIAALAHAIMRASAGEPFGAVGAAIVNGSTAALAALVVMLALPLDGDKQLGDGDGTDVSRPHP